MYFHIKKPSQRESVTICKSNNLHDHLKGFFSVVNLSSLYTVLCFRMELLVSKKNGFIYCGEQLVKTPMFGSITEL